MDPDDPADAPTVPDDGGSAASNRPTIADSWPSTLDRPPAALPDALSRYQLGLVLGRGGMGEVISARDEQIGRSVAIKRLRIDRPTPGERARFLREARIQGRLEHPAIVPVHELWTDEEGRPYFVMKQLTGITLLDLLGTATRQRLLRAFADVCLAIEFAHTRGVIHRDLKPANIVLGDFGDVYVIDWGIARVVGDRAERTSFADIETIEGSQTVAGSILGTPGYISPEQIRGDADLDARADIYALGCILFEILAGEPLHPRGQAGLAMALAGGDALPSQRAPDREIPPELDAICQKATRPDRDQRFATARQLGEAVQHYLDGDRDVELRKKLASTELAHARSALADASVPGHRAAMRAAARALALDPTGEEAADLVARLMIEPPRDEPPEVTRELEQLDMEALRSSARFGLITAIAYLAVFPMLYWIGFRELWYLLAGAAICAIIIYAELAIAPRNPFRSGAIAIGGHLMMIALLSRIVSPFVIGAGPATVMVMLLATHPRLIATWLLAALAGLATLVPWLLAPTTEVSGNALIVHTGAEALDRIPTYVGLGVYLVGILVLAGLLSRSQDRERRAVRRTLQIQSWQLRQLIPH